MQFKTRFGLGALFACLVLVGCAPNATTPVTTTPVAASGSASAPTTPPVATTPTWQARVQAVYASVKSDAAAWVAGHPKDAAVIAGMEGKLDPEVASLSNDLPLSSFSNVLTDIQNTLNALPAGVISPGTKLTLDLAISAVQLGSGFLGFTAPASQLAL